MKKSNIYRIDLWLLPTFIGTVITGFGLHISSHNRIESYMSLTWVICHIILSLIFSWMGIIHIKQHWFWYKNLFKSGKGKKTNTLILTSLLAFEIVTGLLLSVFDSLEGGICGYLHWIAGELLMVFCIIHIVKRWKTLRKAITLYL